MLLAMLALSTYRLRAIAHSVALAALLLYSSTNLTVGCAAARHVLEVLEPLSVEHGGPLLLQHVSYVEGRGNIIVEYPGEPGGGVISFVGAHMVSWQWCGELVGWLSFVGDNFSGSSTLS
jgi:hypothetical protein